MNKQEKEELLKELEKLQGPDGEAYFSVNYIKNLLELEDIDPLERMQEDDSIE